MTIEMLKDGFLGMGGNPRRSTLDSKLETRNKLGFTLVEMLVVLGIIAILAGASMIGYSKVVKSAQKTKNREIVSNAAAALTQILNQNGGSWPEQLLSKASGGKGRLDKDVCQMFVTFNMMGLSHNKDKRSDGTYELIGKDRFGIVDADAEKVLKRSASAAEGTRVPSGGTVQDHILYFAIDEDGDGFTDAQVDGGGNLKIRATAAVWAAGPDGKVDYGTMAHNDDVYSWTPAQVKK